MDKQLAKTIGAMAREARTRGRLTQEDAAELIGISVEFYARIERGTTLPSAPTLQRLARGLHVSADVLLGIAAANGAVVQRNPGSAEPASLRRLFRRLRAARTRTLRIVSLIVTELEQKRM